MWILYNILHIDTQEYYFCYYFATTLLLLCYYFATIHLADKCLQGNYILSIQQISTLSHILSNKVYIILSYQQNHRNTPFCSARNQTTVICEIRQILQLQLHCLVCRS